MEERINKMEKRMDRFESCIEDMRDSVRRIENAVTGDQAYGIIGYREKFESVNNRVDRHDEDIESLQQFKIKVMYYALGGAAVGTVAINILLRFV